MVGGLAAIDSLAMAGNSVMATADSSAMAGGLKVKDVQLVVWRWQGRNQ